MSEPSPRFRAVVARSILAGLQMGIVCGPVAALILVVSSWVSRRERPDFSDPLAWLAGIGLTAFVAILYGLVAGGALGLYQGVLLGLFFPRLSCAEGAYRRRKVGLACLVGTVVAWIVFVRVIVTNWGTTREVLASLAVLLILLLAATWWATGRVCAWYEQNR